MTTSEQKPEGAWPSWFNPKVDAGHMMQAGVLLVALIGWFLISRNNVDTATHDIASMKVDMATGFAEVRASQEKSRAELLSEIRNNPGVDQHFANIERWFSAQEQYNRNNDARMNTMTDSVSQVRADVNAMIHASNAPIRNAR